MRREALEAGIGQWWTRMRRKVSEIWHDPVARMRLAVLFVLVVVGVGSSLWVALRSGGLGWDQAVLNLGTELAGAVVTYILLQRVLGGTESLESRRRELIEQMGSRVHDVAVAAAEELEHRGWLKDGSLRGAYLVDANLKDASLSEANLQGADLKAADLQGAFLVEANLQGATLRGADLEEASLSRANLQGADLWGADLKDASLSEANLQGADLKAADLQGALLWGANLQGADLEWVKVDEATTLPDGTKWAPDTDMARFTGPDHPEFWRSDEPTSPAYRSKE